MDAIARLLTYQTHAPREPLGRTPRRAASAVTFLARSQYQRPEQMPRSRQFAFNESLME